MKRLLLWTLILGLLSFSGSRQLPAKKKTILAVLAHPDDEAAIGQVLSRYASDGHQVYLVIAADGRYGYEPHAGIPPGDSLAQVRKAETICACRMLGIEAPLFLEAHDVFGAISGMGEYFSQTAMVKEKLVQIISQLNPDAIITFGPDGDTGHFDHKLISGIVTEVILMNAGWYEKYPLYYLAWPREKEVWIAQGGQTTLNYVAPDYRNVHIKYTPGDQEKVFRSLKCYRSQYTDEDIEKWIVAEKKDTTFTTFFRQMLTSKTVKTQF